LLRRYSQAISRFPGIPKPPADAGSLVTDIDPCLWWRQELVDQVGRLATLPEEGQSRIRLAGTHHRMPPLRNARRGSGVLAADWPRLLQVRSIGSSYSSSIVKSRTVGGSRHTKAPAAAAGSASGAQARDPPSATAMALSPQDRAMVRLYMAGCFHYWDQLPGAQRLRGWPADMAGS
jgi:hypothetical protein